MLSVKGPSSILSTDVELLFLSCNASRPAATKLSRWPLKELLVAQLREGSSTLVFIHSPVALVDTTAMRWISLPSRQMLWMRLIGPFCREVIHVEDNSTVCLMLLTEGMPGSLSGF